MSESSQKQIQQRFVFAHRLVKKVGKIILKRFYSGTIHSFQKEGNETVTEYDLLIDEFLKRKILKKYNDHWMSEESPSIQGKSNFEWILDPIDGTNNFSVKIPFFCISLALKFNQKTVAGIIYDPIHKISYLSIDNQSYIQLKGIKSKVEIGLLKMSESMISYGIHENYLKQWQNLLPHWQDIEKKSKTTRRLGSAALEIVYVGLEKLGLYCILGFKEWDIAAALFFAENAGALSVINREKNYLVVYHPAYEELIQDFITILEEEKYS